MSIWSEPNTLTAKWEVSLKAAKLLDVLAIDHRMSGGSIDSEENEFAVTPDLVPSSSVVTTVTPVTKVPKNFLSSGAVRDDASIASLAPFAVSMLPILKA